MARIGGRMAAVADYVAAHPACSKVEAARGIGQTCHEFGGGWGPVERAIRAGLVINDWADPRRARLFRTAAAMRDYYYGERADDGLWHPAGHP